MQAVRALHNLCQAQQRQHTALVFCACVWELMLPCAVSCMFAVPHKVTCYGMVSWIPMKRTMT